MSPENPYSDSFNWVAMRITFLVRRTNGSTLFMAVLVSQYGAVVVGAALISSTALVDQAMSGMLAARRVAALTYGGTSYWFHSHGRHGTGDGGPAS